MSTPLQIDFVADLVCPWCYVGWANLKQALAQRPGVEPRIVWRAFQLDPTIPPEGVDREAFMAAKFPDRARREAMNAHLAQAGEAAGIDLRLNDIEKRPNTDAAHRLVLFARGLGDEGPLVEALFRAYWTEGRDIGDPGVLAELAGEAGLDRGAATAWLASEDSRRVAAQDYQAAARSGITGVPFMIFGGRVASSGARPPETLVQAIDKALEAAA
jgi:predicted DsbA family dithiol-disulfide isomerase